MTLLSNTASDAMIAQRRATQRGLFGMYMELTKARLSALVLVTTVAGFVLASDQVTDWTRLIWTLIGTGLAAGCANALNQVMEARLDRLMLRTRNRPIPSGAMRLRHAFVVAMLMGYLGAVVLAVFVNLATAWLALGTVLVYVYVYTPLKTRSTLNTIVGAVCGATPPMIGWVAASGSLDRGAWLLAAILFVWQIPHFFALAWLYREDYRRGGFKMLPVIDRDGHLTCQVSIITALLLLPLGLMATLLNVAGLAFAIGSLALGLWMVALCVRLHRQRCDANARAVFLASIAYLPLVLLLMVVDQVK